MNFNEYLAKHKIIKAEDLPIEEKIYFKRDFLGLRVVNPIKREDMSIDWKAALIANWRSFIFLVVIILAIFLILFAYSHDINTIKAQANGCLDDPIKYCNKVINPYQKEINANMPKPSFIGDEDDI